MYVILYMIRFIPNLNEPWASSKHSLNRDSAMRLGYPRAGECQHVAQQRQHDAAWGKWSLRYLRTLLFSHSPCTPQARTPCPTLTVRGARAQLRCGASRWLCTPCRVPACCHPFIRGAWDSGARAWATPHTQAVALRCDVRWDGGRRAALEAGEHCGRVDGRLLVQRLGSGSGSS